MQSDPVRHDTPSVHLTGEQTPEQSMPAEGGKGEQESKRGRRSKKQEIKRQNRLKNHPPQNQWQPQNSRTLVLIFDIVIACPNSTDTVRATDTTHAIKVGATRLAIQALI